MLSSPPECVYLKALATLNANTWFGVTRGAKDVFTWRDTVTNILLILLSENYFIFLCGLVVRVPG
jgi:hypothetical protein